MKNTIKTTILAVIVALLIILSYYQIIEIDPKYITITTIILIILTIDLDNSTEHLTTISNEGIQDLSSSYNTTNATLGNLTITGTLKVGNNVLISGDSTAQDKIQIYQNGDAKAPYVFVNKQGNIGVWNGTSAPVNIGATGSYLSGDVTVGGNLVLDGTNKWILHTPDDGRKTLYMAPWGTSDWNWGGGISVDNTSSINATRIMNDGLAGFIGDGGGIFVPLFVGQGSLNDIGIGVNHEDFVILAPGYGIRMWNTGSAPADWNSDPTDKTNPPGWVAKNTSTTWIVYNIWGSNKMDFWKVFRL